MQYKNSDNELVYGIFEADETDFTEANDKYKAGNFDLAAAYGNPASALTDFTLGAYTFDPSTGVMTMTGNEKVQNAAYLRFNPNDGYFNGVGTEGNLSAANSTISLTFPGLDMFSPINIDFSTVSMFNNNGTSTVGATNGNIQGLGTGRRLGELSGVSVSKDGIITGTYDNGQSKILGQIAVAAFANAAGLEKAGDNLYNATPNSGDFDGIGVDITANGDYMTSGVLEMSNVDLANEFTTMITTQRGFQANSRIITVSDTLLEELTNLKR